MRLRLLAVGARLPRWQDEAFAEYARRLPSACPLDLVEIALAKRTKSSDPRRAVESEGERLLGAIPRGSRVIALDEHGEAWTTRALAAHLEAWMGDGRDVSLLVGGPDGLAPACLDAADRTWSLSPLTLPHGMIRGIVAEALYRAWTVIDNHPYHRA